jgi:hypothetical protein
MVIGQILRITAVSGQVPSPRGDTITGK